MDADVIIIGGGLAGLVASNELVKAGKNVLIVEQENEANLGGQAFWSFGGMFLVDTPMQRRAAGEASGFGGGGAHGYNALEGTFLGGCVFTGKTVGRSLARAL